MWINVICTAANLIEGVISYATNKCVQKLVCLSKFSQVNT